jgi:RimJ/RimL family protein N-acetyltransferase
VIETARLVLRDWRDEDREPFARLNADPEVMAHFPALLTRPESDAVVDRLRGSTLWAAETKHDRRFIGFIGLSTPRFAAHFTPATEIAFRLARDAWGHGYATEGAKAACAYGFETLPLEEIVSFTAVSNVRSQRVMQRLGMTRSPQDDFDHPALPPGHPLRRHVLYRLGRSVFRHG